MTNSARKRKAANNGDDNKKKTFLGGLRQVELLGIGLLGFALLFYALSRCGGDNKQSKNIAVEINDAADSSKQNNGNPEENARLLALRRKLYVCIDSLKLRTGPYLDSTLVAQLSFGEELTDMGQYSKFEQTLRVSSEHLATEPWVKVKTSNGKVGWVFGAGVRPYPKKRPLGPNVPPGVTPSSPTTDSTINTGATN